MAEDGAGALLLEDDGSADGEPEEEVGAEEVAEEPVGAATVTVTVDVAVPLAPPRTPQAAAVRLHASNTDAGALPECLMTPPRFAAATRWRLDVLGGWQRPPDWSSPG